jgi:hypothetical protein
MAFCPSCHCFPRSSFAGHIHPLDPESAAVILLCHHQYDRYPWPDSGYGHLADKFKRHRRSKGSTFDFSPTDTLPHTRRAKLLMLLQSTISIITLTAIAGAAINILAGGS